MEIHIWDPNGLYIWNPALYRFSGIHRVRAWRRTLRHVQLPRGWRSSTGSTVGLSGAVFSKPTRNRGPSVLLPVWGENTGGIRFHTKAIESSECVRGRPARSSTNICQWGATSQHPGGRYTSRRVSSQPERARHTLLPDKPGWWHPLSSGPSSAWRRHSLSAGLCDRQRAGLRSWSFASCQRNVSMLGRDKAKPGLGLPPPGAALAGSPLGLVVGTLGT